MVEFSTVGARYIVLVVRYHIERAFGENEGELLTLKKVSRIVWYGMACCFVLAFLSLFAVPAAHADGGAPNLAYVAGTSHGISIIDVSQQKVTGSISVTGDHVRSISALMGACSPSPNRRLAASRSLGRRANR